MQQSKFNKKKYKSLARQLTSVKPWQLLSLQIHNGPKSHNSICIFIAYNKSAILTIFQFWQNGTFEPVHGTKKKLAKRLLLQHNMMMTFQKNIPSMSQGLLSSAFLRRSQNFAQLSLWIWHLLSKLQNHEDDCANFCGLLRKTELYVQNIFTVAFLPSGHL